MEIEKAGHGAGRSFWDWEREIWDRDLECLHFEFLEMRARDGIVLDSDLAVIPYSI